jgi:hypothetical protein
VRLSNTHFDLNQPYWQDYLPYLQQLAGADFPPCEQLNAMLAHDLRSASDAAIRFTASTELDDGAYEQRIYTTGQVSTRPDNWHDLFNALVWMRFPRIKLAMNTMHYNASAQSMSGSRGAQRDALTLFDECGVIVFSAEHEPLEALAQRQWPRLFQSDEVKHKAQYVICGHAMLEKFLSPYKAMTAKALLVRVNADTMKLPKEILLTELDKHLAGLLLNGEILQSPACLTPLPLSGIPGWWPSGQQNEDFYLDQNVFRPAPASLTPVPIIEF